VKRALLLIALLGWSLLGSAHPLGNNTVNRWAQIAPSAEAVQVDYVLELAELPTLVEAAAAAAHGDGQPTPAEWDSYAPRWARALAAELSLTLGGEHLRLQPVAAHIQARAGEAGLQILRLEARFEAPVAGAAGSVELRYADRSRAGAAGWKEVVLQPGAGVTAGSGHLSERDRSARLTDFSAAAQGAAVPDQVSGRAQLRFTATAAKPPPRPPAPAAATPASSQPPVVPAPAPGTAAPPATSSGARSPARTLPAPAASQASLSPAAEVPERGAQPLAGYFRLGMHHILNGWDHLLFLLGLLLLRLRVSQTVAVLTAFTLAHSLTLGLAAAGLVTAPDRWVEPAIALSIAYVGALTLLRRRRTHGVPLAFGFGLVHGLGFASAFAASSAGAFGGVRDFLAALAAFNLGIEAAQLAIVLAVVPGLHYLARTRPYPWLERSAASVLVAVGVLVCGLRLAAV
jgi:hydrogenase/urease accessory protein HupE